MRVSRNVFQCHLSRGRTHHCDLIDFNSREKYHLAEQKKIAAAKFVWWIALTKADFDPVHASFLAHLRLVFDLIFNQRLFACIQGTSRHVFTGVFMKFSIWTQFLGTFPSVSLGRLYVIAILMWLLLSGVQGSYVGPTLLRISCPKQAIIAFATLRVLIGWSIEYDIGLYGQHRRCSQFKGPV